MKHKKTIEEAEADLAEEADRVIETALNGAVTIEGAVTDVKAGTPKKTKKTCDSFSTNVHPKGWLYAHALEGIVSGIIRWDIDNFGVMLVSPKYEPSQLHDTYLSQVAPFEVKAKGYERIKLRGRRSWMPSGKEIHAVDDGGPYAWGELTFTETNFQFIVAFQDTGAPETSRVLTCWSMGDGFKHVCGIHMPNPLCTVSVT